WGLQKCGARERAYRYLRLALDGLVARPYEPLADSACGTMRPTKPVLCSRFRELRQAPAGAWLNALLDFDLGAGLFELLLDGFRVGLVDTFLHGLGRAIDEVLGFLQSEARHFTHGLDGVHLVLAGLEQHHGELGLLFDRGGGGAA